MAPAGSPPPRPAFDLSFANGRGVITLARPTRGPLGRVEALVLEIPDLRFPFDVSGGASRFRHRRCRLRQANLAFDVTAAGAWVHERLRATPFGFRDVRLRALPQGAQSDAAIAIALTGSAAVGAQSTEFLFRGSVSAVRPRLLHIALSELRLFEPYPVPAPLLAGGLLRAIVADPPADPPEVRFPGCTDVLVDPLALVLLDVLPSAGWRVPAVSAELHGATLRDGSLILRFQPAADALAPPIPEAHELCDIASAALAEHDLPAERLIGEGETERALEAYQAAVERAPDRPLLHERVLQLLITDPDRDDDVLAAARAALTRLEEFVPALLAEAIVHSRRGRHADAAAMYLRVADVAAAAGHPAEEALARLAAGRAAARHGDRARAHREMERALQIDPASPLPLPHLARAYAAASAWEDLARVRRAQLDAASGPTSRLQCHLALAEICRTHLAQPAEAREHYRAALSLNQTSEPALDGLAETHLALGEPRAALDALQRLLRVLTERGDQAAAVDLAQRISERWEELGDLDTALAHLEQAWTLRPTDGTTLRRLARLLARTGRLSDAAGRFREAIAGLEDDGARFAAHLDLARILHDRDADLPAAAEHLRQALELRPADREAVALGLRIAERRDDTVELVNMLGRSAELAAEDATRGEQLARMAEHLAALWRGPAAEEALLRAARAAPDQGWSARRRIAELREAAGDWQGAAVAWAEALDCDRDTADGQSWFHRGRAEARAGIHDGARRSLERALELAPAEDTDWRAAALALLVDVQVALDDDEGLAQVLERLAGTPRDLPRPGTPAAIRLAGLFGRIGELRAARADLPAAVVALRQAVSLHPDSPELLLALADVSERAEHWDAATEVLAALLDTPAGAPGSPARPRLLLRLGDAASARQRTAEAIEWLERAQREGLTGAERENAARRIVLLHLTRGDPAAAARACEVAAELAETPELCAQHLFEGAELWLNQARRTDEAVRCYEQALAAWPAHRATLDALDATYSERDELEPLARVLRLEAAARAGDPMAQRALFARLAETLLKLGQQDAAREAYASCLTVDERFIPAHEHLAREALARGSQHEAAAAYERLLEVLERDASLEPSRRAALQVEAHLALAKIAHARDDAALEERHLDQVRRLDPRHPEANAALGELLVAAGRREDLLRLYAAWEAHLTEAAAWAAVATRRATLLAELRSIGEAIALLRDVTRRCPEDPRGWRDLCALLRQQERPRDLMEALQRLAALPADAPLDPRERVAAHLEAADVAARIGEQDQAERALRQALTLDASNVAVLDRLIELLRGPPPRTEELDSALARRLDLPMKRAQRAVLTLELAVLRQPRDGDGAVAALMQQTIDADAHTPTLLSAAGRCWERLGRWDRAAAAFELLRRTAVDPADEIAAIHALLRLKSGPLAELVDHADAEALCTRLLELEPRDPLALAGLVAIYDRHQDWSALADAIVRLLELERLHQHPPALELYARLARARHATGDTAAAAEALATAAGHAPSEEQALDPLCAAARELGLADLELQLLDRLVAATDRRSTTFVRIAELAPAHADAQAARRTLHRALELAPAGEQRDTVARALLELTNDATHAELAGAALRAITPAALSPAERWRLARLSARQGSNVEALELLDGLAPGGEVVDPEELRALRSRLLAAAGRHADLATEREREARAEQDPQARATALFDVALHWADSARRPAEARRCAVEAFALQPSAIDRVAAVCAALSPSAAQDAWQLIDELLAADGAAGDGIRARLLCVAAALRRRTGRPWSEVEETYREALDRDPASEDAARGLLEACRERGDATRLVDALDTWSRIAPDEEQRVDALIEAAQLLGGTLRMPHEAQELLAGARARFDASRLLEALAELRLAAGDVAGAEAALVDLAESGHRAEHWLTRASNLARLRGDVLAEAGHLARLRRLRPEDPQLAARLTAACRAAGDVEGLRAVLEPLAHEDGAAALELARLCAGPLDDRQRAHRLLAELVAREPDNRAARELFAEVCAQLGDHDGRLEQLRALHEATPPAASELRGSLLLEIGTLLGDALEDADGAREAFSAAAQTLRRGERWATALRRIVARSSDVAAIAPLAELAAAGAASVAELRRLATLAEQTGDGELAISALQRLRELDPLSDASYRLAARLRERGPDAALADLLDEIAVARLASGRPHAAAEVLLELAAVCAELGQHRRRAEALWRAVTAAPEQPEVADALLEHLRAQDDPYLLAEGLERCADHGPTARRAQLLEELAAVHDALGNEGKAADARERLLTISPDHPAVLDALLEAALTRRHLVRARRLLQRARTDNLLAAEQEAALGARLAAAELENGNRAAAGELAARSRALDPACCAALRVTIELASLDRDHAALASAHLELAQLLNGAECRDQLHHAVVALRAAGEPPQRVVAVCREIVELCPDDDRACDELERALRELGDEEQLVEFLRATAPRRRPDAKRSEALVELAILETRGGDLSAAESACREVLADTPGDAAALAALADVLALRGDWPTLRVELERALSKHRQIAPAARAALAARLGFACLDHLDDPEAGMQWLAVAADESADEAHAFRRLLGCYVERQRIADAVDLLDERRRRVVDPAERAALAEELAVFCETRLADAARAAEAYADAFRDSPATHLACGLRACELLVAQSAEKRALELIDELEPRADAGTRPRLLALRGKVLAGQGRDEEARRAYQRALAEQPDLFFAHAELGQLLLAAEAFAEALPHLRIAADRHPNARDAARAALCAADTLEQLGEAEEALRRYEQAAARDPDLVPAHRALVQRYAQTGDWQRLADSLATLADVAHDRTDRIDALLALGATLVRLERVSDAIHTYRQVLELDPQRREGLKGLRQMYAQTEQWGRCAELLDRELEVTTHLDERAQLHRELGLLLAGVLDDRQRAIEHLTASLEIDEDNAAAAAQLLTLYEEEARFGSAGRLALRMAEALSGGIRRGLLVRAARCFESAGWLDDARQIYRELSQGKDEIAQQAAARLLEVTVQVNPHLTAAATTEGGPAETHADALAAQESAEHAAVDPDQRLAAAGDWEAAADALRGQAAVAENPVERAALLRRLGEVLEDELERPLEALAAYDEAAGASADRATLAVLADAAYRHQDWRRARDAYDYLARIDDEQGVHVDEEERFEVAFRRGVVHESLGATSEADRYYARALALRPGSRPALEARARLALYRDDVPAAIELLAALAELLTSDELDDVAELRQHLGELHLRQGNHAEARRFLEGALSLNPRMVKSMQLLLALHEQLGEFHAADEVLARLIGHTDDPYQRADLLHQRALLLGAQLHDGERAVDCLLKAYDIAPDHEPTLWRLIDYYWGREELDAVADLGEELKAKHALEESAPDRRLVRLAVAFTRVRGAEDAAAHLLSLALSEPELLEPALTDLAASAAAGAPPDQLAALVKAADPEQLLAAALRRALDDRRELRGLAALAAALELGR